MAVLKGYIKSGIILHDELKALRAKIRKDYNLEGMEIDYTGCCGLARDAVGSIWREVLTTLRRLGEEKYVEFSVNAIKDGTGFAIVIIDPSSICTTKKLQKVFGNDVYGFPIREINGVNDTKDDYAIIIVEVA